jgi:integrase
MARKGITGLTKKGEVWHINKVVDGVRICESTGSGSREEAERYLIHRLEKLRQESVYGVRQIRTWRDAATRYIEENIKMPSIGLTATYLDQLDPFIGDLPVAHIDDEALRPFVKWAGKDGKFSDGRKKLASSNRTINIALQRVVRILHLCARSWRDANKRPWIDAVPMITMLDERKTARKPYPLSWDEQRILFSCLPAHLQAMALFKVNTGCREQEVCKLEWEWEIQVPEIGASVFLIPADFGGRTKASGVKNGEERVVVLNRVAKSVIDGQRGQHKRWVFPYRGQPMHRMNDTAWRNARAKAPGVWKEEYGTDAHPGLSSTRVHDLKHTFGRRLRAANVAFEDRQALLGHKSGSVTTHYSGAELSALIEAANSVVATDSRAPVLTMLRRKVA